ncbi:hypothetical protein MPTK1_2g22980 [Marchantia polymorpha subsp. ruderalis]|uniref:AB hydrolase-1 domain-containing protein n=1 Tax=Marchantia polymorpha TaxID=3197 RepID=A0A2R6WN45_MARPO|nr:hypothetical protein MARPO_0072s0033 [Marchantia polymorpha]BBN03367.1 hypothetical protein Mp_2g22980 [Marchantia polymorpha subsp. ruderalis]|eukprot:PTQ35279.1 hypothetical protein MARPO_0072s0033 [Marchantia polymorpha]
MAVLEELGGLKYVRLASGRRICYKEQGVRREEAKRQLMVLHGLGSSRLASMPGVSDTLLKAYGVKIVAIDRPGYGRSDCDTEQTFKSSVQDIEEVADALSMGDKFWLLGYSCGGAFCWACARYIPHRLAGVCLWAPAGNYYWKGISDEERSAMWKDLVSSNKFIFGLGRRTPSWILRLYTQHFVRPGSNWFKRLEHTLSAPDRQHLLIYGPDGSLIRDNTESMTWNKGFGMSKDIELLKSDWGFEPEDVAGVYKGPFHIWQGVEDNLIPVGLQRWVKSVVPELVDLYEVPNEGHLSWFCFNSKAHHKVFEALFGEDVQLNEH